MIRVPKGSFQFFVVMYKICEIQYNGKNVAEKKDWNRNFTEKSRNMEQHQLSIRPAVPDDAEELLRIYSPYVEKTAITFEYEVPSVTEFKSRIQQTLERYPYLVAERNGQIVGYAYAGTFHEREAYDWAVETSIYVDESCRHGGIGGRLYQELEQTLSDMGILNMEACIAYPKEEDETLTANSAQYHEHLGFRMVGRFYDCGCKFGRWYDMVWMEKQIGEHKEHPEKPRRYADILKLHSTGCERGM